MVGELFSSDRVTLRSSSEDKIDLFRSLFRGREDVWARRFESRKTGKSGYAPACTNEWVRGLCEKPRVKCAACPHRRFLPLTAEVIRRHLSGNDEAGAPFVAGIYPMLADETCFVLAADFDKATWRDDAAAYRETCRRLGLSAALERSRSGNGAHVWLFFEEPVPAALARQIGTHILTETMERRPEIGFDSYDRFFPNQDTMPRGGFGNLIALPLQREARDRGNSIFLDDDLAPWPDQWAFLSSQPRARRAHVEQIVQHALRGGRVIGLRLPPDDENEVEPWTSASRRRAPRLVHTDSPRSLDLVLADELYVAKEGLQPALQNRLLRLAAFQNPEFYRAQAMRRPTWKVPRVIACASDHPRHIELPRGCLADVLQLCEESGIEPSLRDERNNGTPISAPFLGALRPEQQLAAAAMLACDTGVLSAATAFGKTVVAAWLIAQRAVNTLVLVHRRQLMDQWIERLSGFLCISPDAIGRIGGGRDRPTGVIDVALLQSLVRKGEVDERMRDYGHLVVDECHHLPAFTFESVTRRATARFVLGLSATVVRKDGHQPIIFMQCGPVRHRVTATANTAARPFGQRVVVRPTQFFATAASELDSRSGFQRLCSDLVGDAHRNRQICDDVHDALRDERSPLVLTERNEHLDELESLLRGRVRNLIVLRGGTSRRKRTEIATLLASIPRDEERVLLATGRYVGEGFDDARLDTLLLTLPVSWRGTVAQYVGRLHRLCDGKREVRVLDYADLNVPTLSRMFEKRCRAYEAAGYTIELPASAVPGWPIDVTLPSGAAWKREYSASVRRLARDGVESPLAKLFAYVASPIADDAEGASRARSAAEAFLYQRLETLPVTRGRFRLNTLLPIPFDGQSVMEADLHCADSRIVIELDGAQHLGDADAWRRDRRKDRLLQENGYLVLRFLTDDVSRELDGVLDAIVRAMENRNRSSESRLATPSLPRYLVE
ncbi:MAG: DEAD/DEAH box helicase family protein [Thermoanaerobaculia bacterium]